MTIRHRNFALFCLLTLLVASAQSGWAIADVVTVPPGLNPGDQYRLVFVTAGSISATSANIQDYNAFVTAAADAVPQLKALGTTWTVIGSTTTVDARDNTGTNPTTNGVGPPIYRLDGKQVAVSSEDLWDRSTELNQPIPITELGDPGCNNSRVWTGTRPEGTAFSGDELGATDAMGVVGNCLATNDAWTSANVYATTEEYPLYAISAPITVPIKVAVDVQPAACPNTIACKSKGLLTLAIAGTPDLDVTTIDPVTVRLAGVEPIRWDLDDVTSPFTPYVGKTDCFLDCSVPGPDGYQDVILKFDVPQVLAALGTSAEDGVCIVTRVTGKLRESEGGTDIVGEDVVRIICKGPPTK